MATKNKDNPRSEKDLVMYHYTNEKAWKGITGKIANNKTGLLPPHPKYPTIYGLLEPCPTSWLMDDFTWRTLMHHCAFKDDSQDGDLILLKVNLRPEDHPVVLDYSYVASGNVNGYVKSKTPFLEYKDNFLLPEVAVFKPLPLERIEFIWKQNLYEFLKETSIKEL